MVATVAAAAALVAPATSQAAFKLTLTGGAPDPLVVNDRYTGSPTPDANDGSNLKGTINFSDTYGGLSISTTSGTSNLPGVPQAKVTTSNLVISNTSGSTKTITVMFSEDGYTGPGGIGTQDFLNGFVSNFTGTGGVSFKFHAQVIENGGGSTYTTSDVTLTTVNSANSPTNTVAFTRATSSYTLISWAEITLDNNSDVTFNTRADVTATPAPAGLLMFATALPFAGLLRRRLRKSEVATVA